MSGLPSAQSPSPASREADSTAPGSPAPAPHGVPPAQGRQPRRKRRKQILAPLALAALGVALLLLAIVNYPVAATGLRAPPFSRLALSAGFPIALIGVKVIQVSPAVAEMKIEVELPAGTLAAPAGTPPAALVVTPPLGTAFQSCPAPFCRVIRGTSPGTSASIWGKTLAFRYSGGLAAAATADFFVRASNFGVAYNGISASAAIPEFIYRGQGTPMLVTAYNIPSAATYDWSSFPTAGVNNRTATWQEDLAGGDTPGRVAVGISPSGQAHHDIQTLILGTLLGLAGAAILSAIQEALHIGD